MKGRRRVRSEPAALNERVEFRTSGFWPGEIKYEQGDAFLRCDLEGRLLVGHSDAIKAVRPKHLPDLLAHKLGASNNDRKQRCHGSHADGAAGIA